MLHVIDIEKETQDLYRLLARTAKGEEILLLRYGQAVARLVPVGQPREENVEARRLPELSAFRESIILAGEPASLTVMRERRERMEQRY